MDPQPKPVNNFYEKAIYKSENNSVASCKNSLLYFFFVALISVY